MADGSRTIAASLRILGETTSIGPSPRSAPRSPMPLDVSRRSSMLPDVVDAERHPWSSYWPRRGTRELRGKRVLPGRTRSTDTAREATAVVREFRSTDAGTIVRYRIRHSRRVLARGNRAGRRERPRSDHPPATPLCRLMSRLRGRWGEKGEGSLAARHSIRILMAVSIART